MKQTPSLKNLLSFQGEWRSYQKRVLTHAEHYLKDGRIHIVAAPGSGKTTLGIELIRRQNAPALILSPSINIRNQWLERIRSAYLKESSDILSNSLRSPGLITAITYQALHSYLIGNSSEDTAETSSAEPDKTMQSDTPADNAVLPDLFEALRQTGIRTLCLDEAHHLRNEWWKALETLVQNMPELTIISLTATPPYDASPAEWQRYINLCGPIDEEIIVPELVKEGSLCPHQDYVYFSAPLKEEEMEILRFREDAALMGKEIFSNETLFSLVKQHAAVLRPGAEREKLLENPDYTSALLIYLHAKGCPLPSELQFSGGADLPKLNLRWLELLLQGFLYDDAESYPPCGDFHEALTEQLKAHGFIHKKKVCLAANDDIRKLFAASKGKLDSITSIVKAEEKNLGSSLRLLILTDYIKKEYLSALGNEERSVQELGVVPIFETLRRACGETSLRLAALSGSVVLIPASAKPALEELLSRTGAKCSVKECNAPGYYQVTVSGSEETASGLLTELFYQGEIQVLIGTKSLLGEGWDSPCINSLILASFVGSFMLSNQMRGRAIRIMKDNPGKISNIWHLVCLSETEASSSLEQWDSPDFSTLEKRFESFLGVHYEKPVIENGLERLSVLRPPYTPERLSDLNRKTLSLAADREGLKAQWQAALAPLEQMELAVEAGVDDDFCKPKKIIFSSLLQAVGFGLLTLLFLLLGLRLFPPFLAAAVLTLFAAAKRGKTAFRLSSPLRFLLALGEGVLSALKKTGNVSSERLSVGVECGETGVNYVYLRGGTEREKDVFAQCIEELFSGVTNQRFLLASKTKGTGLNRYYCVPECFGRRKEDAALFARALTPCIGAYELVYTKNGAGRSTLLAARLHSLAYGTKHGVKKRKCVKNV